VIQAFGCPFLWVHHTGWDGKRERGSSAFRGAADTTMVLAKSKAGVLTLTCEKSRHTAPFPPLGVRLLPAHGSCIVRRKLGTVDGKAAAVLAVLTTPMTGKEWMAATGLAKTTFYRSAGELEVAGLVHEQHGVYSAVADDE